MREARFVTIIKPETLRSYGTQVVHSFALSINDTSVYIIAREKEALINRTIAKQFNRELHYT